jgi:hypothetical protein
MAFTTEVTQAEGWLPIVTGHVAFHGEFLGMTPGQ